MCFLHIFSAIAQKNGLNVIENYCGHGIGEYFHGPPDIIHVGKKEIRN